MADPTGLGYGGYGGYSGYQPPVPPNLFGGMDPVTYQRMMKIRMMDGSLPPGVAPGSAQANMIMDQKMAIMQSQQAAADLRARQAAMANGQFDGGFNLGPPGNDQYRGPTAGDPKDFSGKRQQLPNSDPVPGSPADLKARQQAAFQQSFGQQQGAAEASPSAAAPPQAGSAAEDSPPQVGSGVGGLGNERDYGSPIPDQYGPAINYPSGYAGDGGGAYGGSAGGNWEGYGDSGDRPPYFQPFGDVPAPFGQRDDPGQPKTNGVGGEGGGTGSFGVPAESGPSGGWGQAPGATGGWDGSDYVAGGYDTEVDPATGEVIVKKKGTGEVVGRMPGPQGPGSTQGPQGAYGGQPGAYGGFPGSSGVPGAPGTGSPGIPGSPGSPPETGGGSGGGMPSGVPGAPGTGSSGVPGAPGSGLPGSDAPGRSGADMPGIPGAPNQGYPGMPGAPSTGPSGIPGAPTPGMPGGVPSGSDPTGSSGGSGSTAGTPKGPYVPPRGGTYNGGPQPNLDPMDNVIGPPGAAGSLGGMGGGNGYGSNVPTPANNINPADKAAAQKFLQGTFDQFQSAQDAANKANNDRYNQQLDILSGLNGNQNKNLAGLSGLYGGMVDQYSQGANNVMGQYNNAYNTWAANSANVGRGYDNLNSDLQSRNDLLGAQEGQNIDAAYAQQKGQAEQDLINRGLGNTTVRSAVNRGINYDTNRARTALAQDVNATKNQTDMSTRLPQLNFANNANQFGAGLQTGNAAAQTGLLGNIANLQGQGLQFGERANQAQTNLGQSIVNTIGARTDQGPDYNTMAGLAQAVATGGYGWGSVPSLPAGGTGANGNVQAPSLPYYNTGTQAPAKPTSNGFAAPVGNQYTQDTTAKQPYATVF